MIGMSFLKIRNTFSSMFNRISIVLEGVLFNFIESY